MIQPIESKLKLSGFIDSRQGGRSENQDFAGVAETPFGTLILVCDGMGGMQGGSTASRLAVTSILKTMQNADPEGDSKQILVNAIKDANLYIIEAGKENPDLKGMGTTVTALLLGDKCAIAAYVGDSRIYQLRNGKKIYRSFDHSMVFEMVKKKIITEEQARLSSQSNIILRALGIKENLEVDVKELYYRKNDRFVLCSDGFWGGMPEEDFIQHITFDNAIDKVLNTTCNVIESIARRKGGEYDNLTAAIVEMGQNSSIQPIMTKKAKIIIAVLAALFAVSMAINILGCTTNIFGADSEENAQQPVGVVDSVTPFNIGNTQRFSLIVSDLDTTKVKPTTKLYIVSNHE